MFNSKEHRETSYIDIFLAYCEEALFEESTKQIIEEEERRTLYNKSKKWFDPMYSKDQSIKVSKENDEMMDLFENMDLSNFNK